MRLLISAEEDKIVAYFNPEDVRLMLVEYTKELGDVGQAFDKVVLELKKKMLYK
jgi:hypothetical protein